VIIDVPIATGEVVEVFTGIHVLVHGTFYLNRQVETCIALTDIRARARARARAKCIENDESNRECC
jgi:hypothetical protein